MCAKTLFPRKSNLKTNPKGLVSRFAGEVTRSQAAVVVSVRETSFPRKSNLKTNPKGLVSRFAGVVTRPQAAFMGNVRRNFLMYKM